MVVFFGTSRTCGLHSRIDSTQRRVKVNPGERRGFGIAIGWLSSNGEYNDRGISLGSNNKVILTYIHFIVLHQTKYNRWSSHSTQLDIEDSKDKQETLHGVIPMRNPIPWRNHYAVDVLKCCNNHQGCALDMNELQ